MGIISSGYEIRNFIGTDTQYKVVCIWCEGECMGLQLRFVYEGI